MLDQLPDQMTVMQLDGAGDADVLKLAKRPIEVPGSNEVLVKVSASGINGPDIMQRKGLYPAPPGASDLLGLEISGTVVAVGAHVERWSVGDLVCALTNGGGYAEYCTVEGSHCLPIPEGLSLLEAASLPETYFTIWSNIFMGARLKAGETFLIHGGAGGLGTTAIQLGKAFGARVFATDSPASRCALCRDLGADRVIDYEQEDFVQVVRDEAKGADVVLDIVGGSYIARNVKACAPDGRIVQLAFAQGSDIQFNFMPIMLKRLVYTGSTLRSRPSEFKAAVASELEDRVWPLIEAGRVNAVVNTTLPLAEAAEGHRLMENAGHLGKIMLVVP